ncbi:hypothetical protein HPB50_020296 [Hyalomma asiaticum]|uniref:Uncharacterized protein n=1 Tax=Hyalomma asiaticum TaxID=266040 RepID=A0ACB7T0N8_HYAAI|nr:hypothetical protein HPB50_020296 [Hyalomma asiaticum]
MATRQRHTATAGPGRRNQQSQNQRQRENQRARRTPQHGNNEEYDHRVVREVADDSLYENVMPWPGIVPPPYLYMPPPIAGFPELMSPYSPYGSFVDENGDIFDAYYAGEYADPVDFDVQDEAALYDYHIDMQQQMEYVRFLRACMMRGVDVGERAGEEDSGTGEPHFGVSGGAETPRHAMSRGGCGDAQQDPEPLFQEPWDELPDDYYGPVVTSYGNISVILQDTIRVDISIDGAIRVVNFAMHCTAAINSSGDSSCVCHPCGRVLQEGESVDMLCGTRLAKISGRGITFTALNHGLVYLVDASGTKSTTERFRNLFYDIPLSLLHSNQDQSNERFHECFRLVREARQRSTRNGDEIWLVGGVRIKQTPWGDVQVSRDSGRRVVWTSPTAGTISVATPLVKIALSVDPARFFFVKVGQKKISASAEAFTVRNGSQSAGFDSQGRVTLP